MLIVPNYYLKRMNSSWSLNVFKALFYYCLNCNSQKKIFPSLEFIPGSKCKLLQKKKNVTNCTTYSKYTNYFKIIKSSKVKKKSIKSVKPDRLHWPRELHGLHSISLKKCTLHYYLDCTKTIIRTPCASKPLTISSVLITPVLELHSNYASFTTNCTINCTNRSQSFRTHGRLLLSRFVLKLRRSIPSLCRFVADPLVNRYPFQHSMTIKIQEISQNTYYQRYYQLSYEATSWKRRKFERITAFRERTGIWFGT